MYTTPLPKLQVLIINQIKYIRLDKINPPEFDSRISTTPEDDDDLRDSIRELGILEPLLCKDTTDGIEIIAGHRRFIQAGRAGLSAVPCIISKTTGAESDKIALHENIKRLPLSHIDQAYTFAHLIKKYKMTEQNISTLVGKSIAYVSQHLSLLQSDDTLVQAVHDGRINFSAARELMHCKDPDERQRLTLIVEEHGATSPVVHDWVRESNRETESLNDQSVPDERIRHSSETPLLMYPCSICKTPVPTIDIKVVRLCESCHYLFFTEIEHNKLQQRMEPTPEPSKSSP